MKIHIQMIYPAQPPDVSRVKSKPKFHLTLTVEQSQLLKSDCQHRFVFTVSIFHQINRIKMDLLGSIMKAMDKPPGTSDKEKEINKSK